MKTKFSFSTTSARIFSLICGVLILCIFNAQLVQAYSISNHHAPKKEKTPPDATNDTQAEPDQPEPTITPSPTIEPTSTLEPSPTITPSPTIEPSHTPINTPTIIPTPTVVDYLRPIIIVQEYSLSENGAYPGENVNLALKLHNSGQTTARNILVIFETGELVPLETGGVKAVTQLAPGEIAHINQPLKVSSSLYGVDNAAMVIRVSYVDDRSINFEESFNLSFPIESYTYYQPMPTKTPEKDPNPKLIIAAYRFDKLPLEAGMIFNLELDVINMGDKSARDITLIIGGGSVDYSSSGLAPSGITGAVADFSNFAPYNTGNLRFVGDLPPKNTLTIICPMIVNTTTEPGVHPFKISFAYSDEEGTEEYLDEQMVTILVHRIPRVEISFYRDPGFFQIGNPGILPIQVLNIDKENINVISLELLVSQGTVSPTSVQVGSIESGGYFTQDFSIVPEQPGDMEINFVLNYVDDFNQEKQIEELIELQVEPLSEPQVSEPEIQDSESNQSNQPNTERTNFLSVLWRLLLGLFGLDSGV